MQKKNDDEIESNLSEVLNNFPYIYLEAHKKIDDYARELGVEVNQQQLHQRKPYFFGDFEEKKQDQRMSSSLLESQNPFNSFKQLIRDLQQEFTEGGEQKKLKHFRELEVYDSDPQKENINSLINSKRSKRGAGLGNIHSKDQVMEDQTEMDQKLWQH